MKIVGNMIIVIIAIYVQGITFQNGEHRLKRVKIIAI